MQNDQSTSFIMPASESNQGTLHPSAVVKRVVPYREDYEVLEVGHPFLQELLQAGLHLFLIDGEWTVIYENKVLMLFYIYKEHVCIERIFTYPLQRNKSYASQLLQQFTAVADKTGTTLKLTVKERFCIASVISGHPAINNMHCADKVGMVPRKHLPAWFGKFGFLEVASSDPDYSAYDVDLERRPA